jgi:uncharacterized protein (TIGR04255 family)
MEKICYKQNFITEAIAKVDFLSPLTELSMKIPKAFCDQISKHFPIAESNEITSKTVSFHIDKVEQGEQKAVEWVFWNKTRDRRLSLGQNALALIQSKYSTFDDFSAEFYTALKGLYAISDDIVLSRFGVRYINNITVDEPKPLEWGDYINSSLLASISIPKDKDKITRTFHNLEMNYESFNMRFNFGIHNPDYPAIVKRKSFILDMDAYSTGIQTKEDVKKSLPLFHEKIQEFFEYSIEEGLRTKYLNDAK